MNIEDTANSIIRIDELTKELELELKKVTSSFICEAMGWRNPEDILPRHQRVIDDLENYSNILKDFLEFCKSRK